MKHHFTPKNLSPQFCATCNRDILAHGKHAICESCSNKGECDIFGHPNSKESLLLCDDCFAKEIVAHDTPLIGEQKAIENYTEYFNARTIPIVQLKELYELNGKSFADFHAAIRVQIENFAKILFEQQISTREDEISKLLIEFRAEVRTKLKESDINYQPSIKSPKITPKLIKQSPLDKMAAMLVAKAASRGETMTMIEAKRKLHDELGIK